MLVVDPKVVQETIEQQEKDVLAPMSREVCEGWTSYEGVAMSCNQNPKCQCNGSGRKWEGLSRNQGTDPRSPRVPVTVAEALAWVEDTIITHWSECYFGHDGIWYFNHKNMLGVITHHGEGASKRLAMFAAMQEVERCN